MALTFLDETNESILTSIRKELSTIDKSVDITALDEMSVIGLKKELKSIKEDISEMKTGVYGSWLHDEKYVRNTLIEEAIQVSLDERKTQMENEKLIVGSTYYTGVSVNDKIIEGYKAVFMGSRFTGWMKLYESAPVAKAMQLLRHGTEDDFKKLYVGLADGRVDALAEMCIEHITESSASALKEIGAYCDSRWEGSWPWEIEAPEKFKYMIEIREERNMAKINEMKQGFKKILREFDEGIMDKYDLVSSVQDMQKKVDSMISDFGKLSSTGIEIVAQMKASGEESITEPMQDALGQPLNDAVESLTNFKVALSGVTDDITGDEHHDGGHNHHHHDMGSPEDAMGDNPSDDIDGDAMDDIDIAGDTDERPMKDL